MGGMLDLEGSGLIDLYGRGSVLGERGFLGLSYIQRSPIEPPGSGSMTEGRRREETGDATRRCILSRVIYADVGDDGDDGDDGNEGGGGGGVVVVVVMMMLMLLLLLTALPNPVRSSPFRDVDADPVPLRSDYSFKPCALHRPAGNKSCTIEVVLSVT